MNIWSKIFGKKQTTEDKLNILKGYFSEVHLTVDDVGFCMLVAIIDNGRGMQAHGDSAEGAVNEIYERVHFQVSVQVELKSPLTSS